MPGCDRVNMRVHRFSKNKLFLRPEWTLAKQIIAQDRAGRRRLLACRIADFESALPGRCNRESRTDSVRNGRLTLYCGASVDALLEIGSLLFFAREGPDLDIDFAGAAFLFVPRMPPGDVAHMIQVESLTKLYGEFVAVNELCFTVQLGEVLGLVGPNGAGKTTTLRCLAGIIPPTRGAVRICGHDLGREPISAKRQLAFFTDEPRLFDYLTVQQHLAFTARIYQVADYEKIGDGLLQELELAQKKDALPSELSRGMKQKLAIACGLLHSPKVIYFDEPLTGLDPMGIRRMKDSILTRAREGAAIIISSHLLHLVEEICSHILILKGGRKIIDGTMSEITQKFSGQPGDANLEEVFFKATEDQSVNQ